MVEENDDQNSSNNDNKQDIEQEPLEVKQESDIDIDIDQDSLEVKQEPDIELDALSNGTRIHRKYQLRGKQQKKVIKKKGDDIVNDDAFADMYDCSKCRQSFHTKTGLLNHMRMHQRVKTFTCALCKENFDTNAKLINHKVEHKHDDRVFLCKVCEMAFTNHYDFLIHETTHTKRSLFKCVECGVYKTPFFYKVHIATHYDRKIQCAECDRVFQTKGGLNNHVAITHRELKLVECGECGKQFKDNKSYRFHFASHTGIKKVQCLYCGKGFLTGQQRDTHTRTHTDERPHECDICHLTFRQSVDLKRHKVIHGGKQQECEICGKKYLHIESLKQHMNVHKQVNLLYCPLCNKACQNKQCLKVHMLYIHTTEKAYKCSFCDLEFKDRKSIIRHNKSKAHQRAQYAKVKNEMD